jgi:Flp pilus assembly protein TadG
MSLGGFLTGRLRRVPNLPPVWLCKRFQRDRKASTAVEFALVGLLYFFVLIFAVEGGIYYLQTTVLDLATEQAARVIMINQGANDAGTFTIAPASASALESVIQTDSYGVLSLANIQVAVQMAGPVTGTAAVAGTGFAAIPPVATPDGTKYEYLPGSCTINYTTTTAGAATTYKLNSTASCTAGDCTAAASFSGLPTEGEVSGGTDATSTDASGDAVNTYTGATFSCSAGQDIVVQAQYTGSLLSALVAYLFGPITSTIAFQVEPATT